MEMKWYAIMVIGFMVAFSAGVAVSEYSKNQCRIAFANTNQPIENIDKVCK